MSKSDGVWLEAFWVNCAGLPKRPEGDGAMHCGPQTAVSRCSVRKEAQAHQAPTSGSFGEGRAGGDLDCDSEELQRQSYDYL